MSNFGAGCRLAMCSPCGQSVYLPAGVRIVSTSQCTALSFVTALSSHHCPSALVFPLAVVLFFSAAGLPIGLTTAILLTLTTSGFALAILLYSSAVFLFDSAIILCLLVPLVQPGLPSLFQQPSRGLSGQFSAKLPVGQPSVHHQSEVLTPCSSEVQSVSLSFVNALCLSFGQGFSLNFWPPEILGSEQCGAENLLSRTPSSPFCPAPICFSVWKRL